MIYLEEINLLKIEQINSMDILNEIYFLYDEIKGDTLYRTSGFLIKLKIQFNGILEFLKNPIDYPGDIRKIKSIVKKFLNDAISDRLAEIRTLNLHIPLIEREIMNTLFKGGRYSGNPRSAQYLKSNKKIKHEEVKK